VGLVDEVAEHLLGDVEVGDDPVEHDPAAADVQEGVGGPEIDGHVAAEEAEDVLQARPAPSGHEDSTGGAR
jgi:hypothetical protein